MERRADEILERLPDWEWVDDEVAIRKAVRSPAMLEAADRWEPGLGNLFLIGGTGIGKTACLTRMLRRWFRKGRLFLFEPARDTLYVTPSDLEDLTHPLLVQRAYIVPALVLDGVTDGRPGNEIVSDILRSRLGRLELMTAVGSSLKSEELCRTYGIELDTTVVVEDWS